MNYIILNGINSNTISGLIIQELSSITKPSKRINTTEIDGKDGDIVEYLGYSAYDKSISIGLYGDYDINQVIKYFSNNGTVVFSNEPDKLYYFDITDRVDYERLVKFKTAKVKLHVQPFKYLLNEPNIDVTITSQTQVIVNNQGLEKSKPIITLYGSGTIELLLNNTAVFQMDITDGYVTIDSSIEEANKGTILKNRDMTGEFPMLDVGNNTITWVGTLTRIIISPKSRWL